jgi:hypothetical protein
MQMDMVIRIGKWKGKTVRWVMANDRRYFEWAKVNAPGMFVPFKPGASPRSLDPSLGGKSTYVEPPEVSDEGNVSWTNPRIMYEMFQKALKELGEL